MEKFHFHSQEDKKCHQHNKKTTPTSKGDVINPLKCFVCHLVI